MQPVITVQNLGKSYRINHVVERGGYKTLRESISGLLSTKFKRRNPALEKIEDFWALKDVSFEVQPGEVVGIIGRNGAGKSTLLKILSRITKPSAGSVRLNGRVASLLEVGTGFHPELSGRENIYLNGSILGMSRHEIRRRFDEIVSFSEIEKFLDTPVKRYSSGMYVRLAFAVAAHLDSEILIIDEVLAVGDAQFQKKCLGRMENVARDGRTVLYVSHNMPSVRSLCTRACLIQQGTLTFSGDPEECVGLYLSNPESNGLRAVAEVPPNGRTGNRIKSVRLLNSNCATSSFNTGDPLSIHVEFTAGNSMQHPGLGFIIYTEDGTAVLNANTHYQGGLARGSAVNAGIITCDLGVVPLMAGRYSISFWFGDQYTDSHVLEHAVRFEVLDRDIWGTGKVPPKKCSLLWWPTRFSCKSSA